MFSVYIILLRKQILHVFLSKLVYMYFFTVLYTFFFLNRAIMSLIIIKKLITFQTFIDYIKRFKTLSYLNLLYLDFR